MSDLRLRMSDVKSPFMSRMDKYLKGAHGSCQATTLLFISFFSTVFQCYIFLSRVRYRWSSSSPVVEHLNTHTFTTTLVNLQLISVCVLPGAVQVDLTRVQLNVLPLIKDAVDDGFQHLMQIQHPDSLTAEKLSFF